MDGDYCADDKLGVYLLKLQLSNYLIFLMAEYALKSFSETKGGKPHVQRRLCMIFPQAVFSSQLFLL